MKTVILSAFPQETQFIKDALFELQEYKSDKFTWYKGKFYTKDLLLVEIDGNTDIGALIELLSAQTEIGMIISIGLGRPLNDKLRSGDVLITDLPVGSCEKAIDLFLGQTEDINEIPLRIFVGQIQYEYLANQEDDVLACLDKEGSKVIETLKEQRMPALLLRVITPNGDENDLEIENRLRIAQKLLMLLKKSVELTS
ncbi:MAG: 5'-methylthioadenosine/S-adenosylhomocysteine nucleosidase [Clostridia bacterium]|jgi:nucleoside phosphorylase|nr:5'-methylthioadenosine/S-adenosylhomocysteine nucleosidase [Clostridia bacterium]